MTIDAPCPNCGTVYTVRRDLIGKRTKCTRCGTPFVIAEMAPARAAPINPPQPPAASPAPAPDQGFFFADIPIHESYAPLAIPPTAEQAAPRQSPAPAYDGFEQDKSRPRYPALKMVARGYDILAVILLAVAVITLIAELVRIAQNPQAALPILVSSGMVVVWAMATALMCLFFSQLTRLALQVEQNTRETSEACRQLADHLTAIQTEQ